MCDGPLLHIGGAGLSFGWVNQKADKANAYRSYNVGGAACWITVAARILDDPIIKELLSFKQERES